MALRIDRCVCYDVRFANLREVADRTDARSIAALQRHVEFGRACRLCHPYVRRMLETGEVVFREIVQEKDMYGSVDVRKQGGMEDRGS